MLDSMKTIFYNCSLFNRINYKMFIGTKGIVL